MFKKTYESITSGLTTMVKQLDDLAKQEYRMVTTKEDQVKKLNDEIGDLNKDIDRCVKTRKNIELLMGGYIDEKDTSK